jgi:branched-chain amino acid transport system ATP-binding protein
VSLAPLLSLEGVTKRFGGLTAVREVSLEVRRGDLLGGIVFDGHAVTGWPAHAIARLGLTRTFQIVKPFGNLSVLDNVMIGALTRRPTVREARADAERVIGVCGLGPHATAAARALPLALRKRLEVARALATGPRLLLLDEVMAGLNPTELVAMIELIRRLHGEGLTLIVIEHVMAAMMRLAQRIVMLHHGEKIAEGTPREIASDRRVIDAYLGEEFVLAEA